MYPIPRRIFEDGTARKAAVVTEDFVGDAVGRKGLEKVGEIGDGNGEFGEGVVGAGRAEDDAAEAVAEFEGAGVFAGVLEAEDLGVKMAKPAGGDFAGIEMHRVYGQQFLHGHQRVGTVPGGAEVGVEGVRIDGHGKIIGR